MVQKNQAGHYIFGVFAGGFVNTYLLTKWKILARGKFFWLRSIGSSSTGQFVFTVVTLLFDMLHVLPLQKIIQLICLSFTLKIVITFFAAWPSTILVIFLQKTESIDVYDYNTDFNPFNLARLK